MPRDYNIPTSDTAGSMTLEDLLPGIDFSKYDTTDFEDIIPEFSTALLDITKAQGKEDIAGAISGGQEAFMQTPTMSAVAGAGGFGGAGGGGRGLIGYESAQRGMFGDVFGAMLGAERAEISELDRMKKEAAGFWDTLSTDVPKAEEEGTGLIAPTDTYDPSATGPPGWPSVGAYDSWVQAGSDPSMAGSFGWVDPDPTDNVTVPGGCFLAGTGIDTVDNIVPIEMLKVGDIVRTYDLKNKKHSESKITETYKHEDVDGHLIINGIIKTTVYHPFYSDGEWIKAGDLSIGDKILHVDGVEHKIDSIDKVNGKIDVYNIEVDDTHNYFAEGYLVHNK